MNKFLLVLIVSLAPLFSLFLRGVLWGADSFAFLGASCGLVSLKELGHPFFAQFVPLFSCNFYLIIFVMWVFYFFGLIGVWVFGNFLFKNKGFLLPIVFGSVGVLFFVEGLRFENQLFGVCLSLMALGLFTLTLSYKKSLTGLFASILGIITCFLSILCWFPSLFILAIAFFLLPVNLKHKNNCFFVGLIFFVIMFGQYFFFDPVFQLFFFPTDLISENLPLVGVVFILHIIHFYKYIPKNIHYYSLFLIFLGLANLKYMFFATLVLSVGLIVKELDQGLWVRDFKIPLIPISFLILGLLIFNSLSFYPTQSNVSELDLAIKLASDKNIDFYNDWGDGWLVETRGYSTVFKRSRPQPDWNSLDKPFVAYTKTVLDCEKVNSRTWLC